MKKVKLGDVFMWQGQLTQAKWMNPGEPSVGFVTMDTVSCPHCGQKHDVAIPNNVIVASPLFQQNAEPVQTISNTHGITSFATEPALTAPADQEGDKTESV